MSAPMNEQIALNDADRLSPAWAKVMKYCDRRIAILRQRNDAQLDEKETCAIRAEIKVLKGIQAMGKPLPDEN